MGLFGLRIAHEINMTDEWPVEEGGGISAMPEPTPELPEIKLFGKWSLDDVQLSDMSLQDYIAVKKYYAKYLPHSAGRYAAKRFRKAQCPIVERLSNSLMMHDGTMARSSLLFAL